MCVQRARSARLHSGECTADVPAVQRGTTRKDPTDLCLGAGRTKFLANCQCQIDQCTVPGRARDASGGCSQHLAHQLGTRRWGEAAAASAPALTSTVA